MCEGTQTTLGQKPKNRALAVAFYFYARRRGGVPLRFCLTRHFPLRLLSLLDKETSVLQTAAPRAIFALQFADALVCKTSVSETVCKTVNFHVRLHCPFGRFRRLVPAFTHTISPAGFALAGLFVSGGCAVFARF
jgi:hypothetical protein